MEAIAASPIEVGGRTLKIGDIAQVRRGYEEPPSFRIFNDGQPSLMLGVNMRPQFNGLKLDENLGVAESEINKALPLGIHFVKIADQAVNITHAVNAYFIKFLVALSVVLLVTLLTLGLRVDMIVAAAVPLTLGVTFISLEPQEC